MSDATSSPPPRAAELGFTRVRPLLFGRSRIYPTSAGGTGRGHRYDPRIQLTPSPTLPRLRGREHTELAAPAHDPAGSMPFDLSTSAAAGLVNALSKAFA